MCLSILMLRVHYQYCFAIFLKNNKIPEKIVNSKNNNNDFPIFNPFPMKVFDFSAKYLTLMN